MSNPSRCPHCASPTAAIEGLCGVCGVARDAPAEPVVLIHELQTAGEKRIARLGYWGQRCSQPWPRCRRCGSHGGDDRCCHRCGFDRRENGCDNEVATVPLRCLHCGIANGRRRLLCLQCGNRLHEESVSNDYGEK